MRHQIHCTLFLKYTKYAIYIYIFSWFAVVTAAAAAVARIVSIVVTLKRWTYTCSPFQISPIIFG